MEDGDKVGPIAVCSQFEQLWQVMVVSPAQPAPGTISKQKDCAAPGLTRAAFEDS